MNTTEKERFEKYYIALNDLHGALDRSSRLTVSDFTKKHKLSKPFTKVIQDQNIIKQITKGRYKWVGNAPTKSMVEKVLFGVYDYQKQQRLNTIHHYSDTVGSYKPVEIVNIPTDKEESKTELSTSNEIKYYELKVFFGLFKLKIKPIYDK